MKEGVFHVVGHRTTVLAVKDPWIEGCVNSIPKVKEDRAVHESVLLSNLIEVIKGK